MMIFLLGWFGFHRTQVMLEKMHYLYQTDIGFRVVSPICSSLSDDCAWTPQAGRNLWTRSPILKSTISNPNEECQCMLLSHRCVASNPQIECFRQQSQERI